MGIGAAREAPVQPDGPCVVHLFGRSRVDIGGDELSIHGPIKRGLLSMLALDLGRAVHVDRLVDGLWDHDDDRDVVRSLRVHVSQLRNLLDNQVAGARQYVEGRYPLYRLSDQVTSDFARAAALRDRALDRLAHDPAGALHDLDAARRLVPEDPLAEVLHLPFARDAVDSLRAFQRQLAGDYAELAAAAWGSRDPGASAPDLSRATPMDERRWRLFTRLVDASPEVVAPAEVERPPAGGLRPVLDDERRAVPTAVPTELASRVPAIFVGRQRERIALFDQYSSVEREGRTAIVQLVGPGGVGKTSLAATIAQDLAADGSRVLYASWSGATFAAHEPFVQGGLLAAGDPDRSNTNPPLGQDAFAAEIIDHLRELAALGDRPLTLILDDVHRLPTRYHSVLLRILECPDLAVLALLLQRPEPAGRDLDAVLPADRQRLRLRPFSEGELSELADALGQTAAADGGRNLPWVAGLLLGTPGEVPDDRLGEAVEQLWLGDRELLERLALAPDGLMLRTLQHDSGFTPIETLDRLRRLVADGLVTEVNGNPPRFVVAHELVADAVRECAGPARCIERSASLHDALLATAAAPAVRVPHALAAADVLGGSADDTVRMAAELLVREGAFADTIALAEAAREAGAASRGRARIVVDGARLLGQAALGERNDAAVRLLDLARDAGELEEWESVTTVLQWRTRLGVGDPAVGTLLESALAVVDRMEPRLRFEILWCLVFHTMFSSGRITEAAAQVDEMLRIADDLRDPSQRARALACSHWIHAARGAPADVLDALSDAFTRYAEEAQDDQLISGAHAGRIGNAFRRHALDDVETHAAVLRRARDPHTHWRALLVSAMVALDSLDLAGAEATISEASTYARDRGLVIRGDEAMAQTFVLHWARGSLCDVRPLLEMLQDNALGQRGWSAALALARFMTGDRDSAIELGTEIARTTSRAESELDWYSIITAAILSDVAYFGRNAELAGFVIEQLTPRSGGRVLLGLAVDLGPVDRYLALAHAVLGADDEAQQLRARAQDQAGCALWRTRTTGDERATGRIVMPTEVAWSWVEAAR